MNRLRPLPIYVALVATLLVSTAAEASERKCRTTRNGLPVDASAAVLVLNGQILGTLGVDGRDPRPGDVFMSEVVPTPDDVISISIICLEVMEGDRKVGLAAIAVTTKTGAEAFMRSHLQALSALQEEHRAARGGYARSLSELAFFDSRAPLPIQLTAHEGGWVARVELEGVSTSCRVHGGAPGGLPLDQPANAVHCVPLAERR
jgi:hypothetical protein